MSRLPRSAEAIGLAAGLVTVIAWGSAFVAIRAADHWFAPGTIALGRLLVSCAALAPFAIAGRDARPAVRDLVRIAVYGVLWLALYSVVLNAAERTLDAGTAAMIINAGPIVIAILGGLFLGEGFPSRLFAGCAVAFVGCAVIALGTAGARSARWQGIGLCVVAVVAYAGAVVIQKPALARVSALRVTFYGCVAAAVACAPFLPGMASEIAKAPPAEVLWIVYLGLVPTSLGFATWSIALRRTTAGRAGALNFLIPVVAVVLGWAVLRESPAPLALAGGALTLLGVYTARRTRRRAPDPADRARLIPQADPAAQPPSRGAG